MKRRPIELKKLIISILKKKVKISVKQLERKIHTNHQTIINNCEELAYFGLVKMYKTSEGSLNGREYLVVELVR